MFNPNLEDLQPLLSHIIFKGGDPHKDQETILKLWEHRKKGKLYISYGHKYLAGEQLRIVEEKDGWRSAPQLSNEHRVVVENYINTHIWRYE